MNGLKGGRLTDQEKVTFWRGVCIGRHGSSRRRIGGYAGATPALFDRTICMSMTEQRDAVGSVVAGNSELAERDVGGVRQGKRGRSAVGNGPGLGMVRCGARAVRTRAPLPCGRTGVSIRRATGPALPELGRQARRSASLLQPGGRQHLNGRNNVGTLSRYAHRANLEGQPGQAG